jgi:AraC-like DNA-binding protein
MPDFLPEIWFAGCNSWTRRHPQNLGGHSHADCWEICYLFRGQIEWWSGDQLMTVRANDLFVIPPSEQHGGIDTVLHRTDCCWITLDIPPKRDLPRLRDEENAAIAEGFAEIERGPRCFPGDASIAPAFATILLEGRAESPMRDTIARGALHQLLAGTVRSFRAWRRSGAGSERRTPEIQAAVDLLRARLNQAVSIEEVARAAGLGRSRLHERFVAETGLSPAEFHTHLRVDRAKELLPGATNAEVARALGFATPRHFAEVFKRATGQTPAAWRGKRAG